MVLAKLTVGNWIAIVALIPPIVGLLHRYLQRLYPSTVEIDDVWKHESMLVKMWLHRFFAPVTLLILIIILSLCQWNHFGWVLLVMFALEMYWHDVYLKRKAGVWAFNRDLFRNMSSEGAVRGFSKTIREHYTLKVPHTEYPVIPLLIEGFILALLCIFSGGVASPFLALFIFFCTLGLYVLDCRSVPRLVINFLAIIGFYAAIYYVGGTTGLLSRHAPEFAELSTRNIEKNVAVFLAIFIYSGGMCAVVLYSSAWVISGLYKIPLEQSRMVLSSIRGTDLAVSEQAGVFFIGNAYDGGGDNTLALMPYCARNKDCPVEKQDPDSTECRELQCGLNCPIGRLSKAQNNCGITSLKVVSHSHNIDDALTEFTAQHEIKRLVAVCCPSNLGEYLPEFIKRYPQVSVVFAPLMAGYERCISSIVPSDRPQLQKDDRFSNTTFDFASLTKFLS